MADPDLLETTDTAEALDEPWNVIVYDDPVNLMQYVTWVLMKVFHYDEALSKKLMMEVHQLGKSIVWTGQREKAEHYTQQLHAHQLQASLEKTR